METHVLLHNFLILEILNKSQQKFTEKCILFMFKIQVLNVVLLFLVDYYFEK